MSATSQVFSAFFTALPGSVFFTLFLHSGWIGREYWWGTYLTVLIALLFSALFFGFTLPAVFLKLKFHQVRVWILVQGLLAWILALFLLGFLNLTPLCIGQDNGDGNNDFAMCNLMTALAGIVYMPLYLSTLVVSSLIGHWVLQTKLGRNS